MTPWGGWHPRAGSLRRFLLRWLLGGLWLGVAAITLWQAGLSTMQRGRAQDERLVGVLAAIPPQIAQDTALSMALPAPAPLAPGDPAPGPSLHRLSAMNGDWLSGERGLAPYPWRAGLSASGTPALYVGHVEGTLVRGAAALRQVVRDGGTLPAVVQVAAPWRERLPSWHELVVGSPLRWVYGLAVVMSLVVWSGVAVALRWLGQVDGLLHEGPGDAVRYDGPSELGPTVHRVQELHASQRRWVEEQRRFLADASHQLRTPMSVLRTQLQSAIAGDVPASEVLPQMLHTVDRAAGLANQLLSLTKLEQLKRSGELQPVSLHASARDAVMELSPLVAAKRLDFGLDGPVLHAPGDPVMLGELLRNLLANAIHHTPPAGRLGILLRDSVGRTELVVWDEGPGIDDDVRPRLFQPFSATKGGVGLGLSICRQIAEAMGASVNLYNRIDNGRVIGVDAVVAWGQGP